MTTAAIYARKSTDDNDKDAVNKSVTRQVERARDYAKEKGWVIEEDLIFTDDGISGAEYVNRPGLARLMTSLKRFDVLLTSEASRLGRDMTRNAVFVLDLIENGKQIFYYLTDEEERADTPEQKILVTLRSYASEVERLKAGQRSRDALLRRAKCGFNAGGAVYGYDNVPVCGKAAGGVEIRTHTDYQINVQHAEVLRNIFRMYAAGHGHVTIAKTLNGDPRYAAPSDRYFGGQRPASPRKGTGSWAPSSVRAMLYNERYTGVVPFGEFQKVYKKGTKARIRRDEKDILRTSRPDLRIIPKELWNEVQERLAAVKKTYVRDTHGKLWGRPGKGVESKYLLTGLAECGCCKRNITMVGGRTGPPGRQVPSYYYGCSYHLYRGPTVCANGLRARMNEADELVLRKIRETVLTPEAIDYTIDKALNLLTERRRESADVPDRLEADLRTDRRQRENFLALVADGKAPASILGRIADLDAAIADGEKKLQNFIVEDPTDSDLKRLRIALRGRLAHFNQLMLSDIPIARQALRKLLVGRIAFHPEETNGSRAYMMRWSIVTKPLLEASSYIGMASPGGFEPPYSP
jgi:site-specific DNA recombinase